MLGDERPLSTPTTGMTPRIVYSAVPTVVSSFVRMAISAAVPSGIISGVQPMVLV